MPDIDPALIPFLQIVGLSLVVCGFLGVIAELARYFISRGPAPPTLPPE